MGRTLIGRISMWLAFAALSGLAWPAMAAWELNMPRGVTDISREVYDLHMLIFWVCVVIGIAVFGAMIYSIINHRKSVNPEPATFVHSTTAEIAWTTIPVLILVAMAYPAAKALVKIEDAGGSDITVQVTGYQWNWHYEYPKEGISFYSKLSQASNIARQKNSGIDVTTVPNYLRDVDNQMVVPVGKKIRILLTSNDVIHAWWVPELGGKKDAIPGFINTMWFNANQIGRYRGQCAELCGRDHGFMPIVVNVVSEADYQNWVASRTSANPTAGSSEPVIPPDAATTARVSNETVDTGRTDAMAGAGSSMTVGVGAVANTAMTDSPDTGGTAAGDMMEIGEQVYQQHCSVCHQPDGSGLPPAFPKLTGSAVATGPVKTHIANVVRGVPGTAMVAFGSILSDEQIAGVVTYERNALGNNVGDQVAPADVAAVRSE